jgi:integrase
LEREHLDFDSSGSMGANLGKVIGAYEIPEPGGLASKMGEARKKTGHIFRAVSWSEKHFWVRDKPLDPATLFHIVRRYGLRTSKTIAPHDLRRTFARLAYEGDAPPAQIQLALGHASQTPTEKYVNAQQGLQIAPSDMLGININT